MNTDSVQKQTARKPCCPNPAGQATLAYQTGNKALAKELGGKGRAANEAMKAAHRAASSNLFATRNALHVQVCC